MYQKIQGEVIHGKKLGRTIGFPTANIFLSKNSDVTEGTYAANTLFDGKVYRGVATFRRAIELFEVHMFDFDKLIYSKNIEVVLYNKIRDNKYFHCLEDIKKQIELDVAAVRKLKNVVLTFGTFDFFHLGHHHYLTTAKMYGNILVTVVATDENREKITGKKPSKKLSERLEILDSKKISDIVEPGSRNDPLMWIKKYSPQVICLGYDQIGFSQNLEEYILKYNSKIQIIRIDSFEPQIYKSSKFKNNK